MAGYSTSNPPKLVLPSFTNTSGEASFWVYSSVDNATTVDVPGYFTNAKALGIKVGDYIWVIDNDASPVITTTHRAVSYSGDTLTITTGDTFNTGTSGS
jgi:hypothetical protein